MLDVNRAALGKMGILKIIEDSQCEETKYEDGKLMINGVELDEEKFKRDLDIKSIDTVFLLGFGKGKMLRELRKKFPKTVVVVIEVNPCIMKRVLEKEDLSWAFKDEKVVLILTKDEASIRENIRSIVKLLERRLQWGDHVFLVTDGYDKIEGSKVETVKEQLYKNILPILTNRTTLLERSRYIVENAIKNIPSVALGGMVEDFNDLFKGKPAVIVASGPSLSKNINLLKEVHGKAVVIAVDSVLPVLEKFNIKADFVCGVDYQKINMEKYTPVLKKRKKENSIYITADGVFYAIPKIFEKSFFEFYQLTVTSLFLKPEFKKRHFPINAVTHLAIQFAYFLGCNPIIFLGQDWAYSYAKDHADGSSIEGGLPKDVVWVRGNYQENVPTNPTLYSGLKLVEDMIRETGDEGIEFINATEGGAYIEGTKIMSFSDVVDIYLKKPIEKDFLQIDSESKLNDLIEKAIKINNRLGEIIKKAAQALSINNRILKKWMRNRNTEEIRSDVEKVNAINDEITFDEIFSSTTPNFFFKEFYHFHREEIDIEGQDTKNRIEQSIKYFTLIKEKTVEIKKYFDELLDFLKLTKECRSNEEKFLKNRDKMLKLAELYFKFRDLYTGIDFVEHALKVYPDDAFLYYWKAKYCTLNRFMHKEALENFERALELDPDFKKARFDYEVEKKMVESHMILAKRAAERKEYIVAKRLIERALDYEPENEKLKQWRDVAEELAKTEKNAQRQNLLLKQLELEGEAFEKYKTAIEFVKKEQMEKAFDILKELYEKYGNFADIPFLLGSIYIDKKELDKAEKFLKEAVELIPYQPLVYLALGKLYLLREDYATARENLERAVNMNPDLKPGVLDTLGNLYYEFGEFEKAFKTFEEYLPYSDDKIKTLTKIALCYKELGMVNEYNMLMEKIKSITGAN